VREGKENHCLIFRPSDGPVSARSHVPLDFGGTRDDAGSCVVETEETAEIDKGIGKDVPPEACWEGWSCGAAQDARFCVRRVNRERLDELQGTSEVSGKVPVIPISIGMRSSIARLFRD
jgi:hypothetical protein